MAPRRHAASSTAPAAASSSAPPSSTTTTTKPSPKTTAPSLTTTSLSSTSSPQEIVRHIWRRYLEQTPQRTLLLDAFLAFLVLVGVIQFAYCVLAGNYPFNAFLSGFSAAVGQFVLTVSLRMQTSDTPNTNKPASKGKSASKDAAAEDEIPRVSSERAFADYVFGSLILHFFCINFIN